MQAVAENRPASFRDGVNPLKSPNMRQSLRFLAWLGTLFLHSSSILAALIITSGTFHCLTSDGTPSHTVDARLDLPGTPFEPIDFHFMHTAVRDLPTTSTAEYSFVKDPLVVDPPDYRLEFTFDQARSGLYPPQHNADALGTLRFTLTAPYRLDLRAFMTWREVSKSFSSPTFTRFSAVERAIQS